VRIRKISPRPWRYMKMSGLKKVEESGFAEERIEWIRANLK